MRYPKAASTFLRYTNNVTSVIAIFFNVLMLIKVTLLITNTHHEENFGIIFLPFTLLIHSFIVFSFLGFLNLNAIKHSKKYLVTGAIISSLTIMVNYVFLPLPYFIIGGLLFLFVLMLVIKYMRNLNLLPLLLNTIVIATGLYFLDLFL